MDGVRVGLKFAVLSVQMGFATTLLATAGSGRSGARAHAAATACKRLSSMTTVPPFPCSSHRDHLYWDLCVESIRCHSSVDGRVADRPTQATVNGRTSVQPTHSSLRCFNGRSPVIRKE